MSDLGNVLIKCVKGEKVNRNDEEILYNRLGEIFGYENVLTEINLENDDDYYFGCAIRMNEQWRVYNLIGDGGVVVKFGRHFSLCVKAG